jgi:HEAT repeat protein
LKDEDKGIRLYAVRALGRYEVKYPFSDFGSEMIPMLGDREPDVREAAAHDIKKIDPEQAKKLGIQ